MRLHQCRDNEPGRQLAWSRVSVLPSTPLGWKSMEKADCSDMIFPQQLQHCLRPLAPAPALGTGNIHWDMCGISWSSSLGSAWVQIALNPGV